MGVGNVRAGDVGRGRSYMTVWGRGEMLTLVMVVLRLASCVHCHGGTGVSYGEFLIDGTDNRNGTRNSATDGLASPGPGGSGIAGGGGLEDANFHNGVLASAGRLGFPGERGCGGWRDLYQKPGRRRVEESEREDGVCDW